MRPALYILLSVVALYASANLIFTGEARSTPTQTNCAGACNPGDLDGDYDVDFADFLAFAGVWGTTYPRPTRLTDRDVLVSLYNSTNGETWRFSTNWLTDNDLSTWHGVFVTNGRVWGINLEGNNLNGAIPPDLGKLSHLSHLNLASNRLTGTIPPELGELSNLSELVLAYNQLSGPIPPELGNLYNLRLIHFAGNQLSGPIPAALANLRFLESL